MTERSADPASGIAACARSRDRSAALFEQARTMFPGGVSSPVRAFKSVHGPPLFIERGEGAMLFDVDGHAYIDFCGSWGPLIHGHADPDVLRAITEAVARGTSFGAPTRLENELGEMIVGGHRYLDRIRFVSSGTEAVMSAIRLARGFTGRDIIVKFEGCYHGHVDSLLVKAGSGLVTLGVSTSAGIPAGFVAETRVLPLDDEEALDQLMRAEGERVAAIIIEPMPANNGLLLQRPEFLLALRETCDRHGALLIFDEVITGFRVGFEGAAAQYGIRPDLITMGKVVGGGMPVGVYGGRADIMACVSPDGDVYQAGTLSGNPVAMAAGAAQLRRCLEPGFYEQLDRATSALVAPLEEAAEEKGWPVRVARAGSIFWIAFTERWPIRRASGIDPAGVERFKTLHAGLLDRGMYLGPSGYEVGFVSSAHDPTTVERAAGMLLEGMQDVFA